MVPIIEGGTILWRPSIAEANGEGIEASTPRSLQCMAHHLQRGECRQGQTFPQKQRIRVSHFR